jgi:integrase
MQNNAAPNASTTDRTETGQSKTGTARAAKTHQDYWRARLRKRTYIDGTRKRVEIPEWQVRMFHLNREAWFNLGTPNQAAAAMKARDVYLSLVSAGWDATLAKFKPSPAAKASACTVGEFLGNVAKRSHLQPRTLRRYAVKLRKMIADVAGIEKGLKAKQRRKKYDYATGGRAAWLAKVDALTLDRLSSETVTAWRNAYVAKAGSDPTKRKSAERSAASYLRCVRALFSPDVLGVLNVQLPSNPFAGVKLKDPGPQRYVSDINPEWLLTVAQRELLNAEGDDEERAKKRQQYHALFLCLWAGLRRKEADLLLWEQVDLAEGQIHVRRTKYFEPKTEESQRTIDLAPEAVDVLRSFKKGATSEFVLEGAEPDPKATYDYYRCDCTWRFLNAWLKSKGVTQPKAVHSLRKESGSIVASVHGIEAARHHLGHRDIRTTSAHYVGKKKRVEVRISTSSLEKTA